MAKDSGKKQLIMDVTRDFILDVGLQAASIGKISKKSGIPVGSIYHAFANKEDLVNQVYIRSRDRIVKPGLMQGEGSIETILRTYLRGYIDNALSHPEDFLFVERHHLSPVIIRENLIHPDVTIGSFKLTDLMKQGVIRERAPEILDTAIVGMLHHCIAGCLSGMISLGDAEKQQLVDICWDAISGS